MVAAALTLALLSASPSASGGPQLAAPGLSSVNLSEKEVTFYSDHLAQQMLLRGVKVITASEIGALLGFERQKELLGCADSSTSCIAEIGAALGADGMLVGSVGKFGSTYQLNAKVLSTRSGQTLTAYSERVNSVDALLDALTRAAERMTQGLAGSGAAALSEGAVSARAPGRPLWPWISGGVAVGLGVAGIAVASGQAAILRSGNENGAPLSLTRAGELRTAGRTFEYGGYVVGAVGVGLLGYGLVQLLLPGGEESALVPAVGTDGRTTQLSVGGRF